MLRNASRRSSRLLSQLRGYAAQAEVAQADSETFLRFGSPFAPQLNLNSALAQLPETKVSRSIIWTGGRSRVQLQGGKQGAVVAAALGQRRAPRLCAAP